MNFTPKILAYVCTYCTYTAADMAGSARMQYPATVRIIKYLCTGRIDIIDILKGFEAGADAISRRVRGRQLPFPGRKSQSP